MKERVLYGVLCALIVVLCLVLSVYSRVAFFVICSVIAAHEMANAFKKCGYHVEKWPMYALCILGSGLLCLSKTGFVFPLFMMIVIALFAQLILTGKPNVKNLYATLGVMAYPLSPILLMVYISLNDNICAAVFLGGIVPAIVSDTFALFGGRKFGKHKLSPHISPKKTVEGLICGLIMGTLSGFLIHYILVALDKSVIPLWGVLIASFLAAVAGAFGDLAASSVKREAGIKDYSNLIPGHGGILDRTDSALFAIPVCYMIYAFFI